MEKKKIKQAMSRRARRAIFISLAVLGAAVIGLDRSGVLERRARQPQADQSSGADIANYHAKRFVVVKVVDGDTLDIGAAEGGRDYTRIRLWGIDTPETKHPEKGIMYFGPEASEFAERLAMGKEVRVFLDEQNRTRDKYGRLLAYIQLPDGRFLNELLVSEGYAYADLRFRHSFYNKYQQLQASARRQGKGLWPQVRREQLPDWLAREAPELLVEK